MPEETTKQAAVDAPDGSAAPGTEGKNSAQGEDLDAVLQQFVDATGSTKKDADPPTAAKQPSATKSEQTPDSIGALRESVEYLQSREITREKEEQTRRFNDDMGVVLKKVRGEMNSDFFDDDFVHAWIDSQATKNPNLAQAWVNRGRDPKGFQRVVDSLQGAFQKKYGKLPDPNLTEDRDAVTAAVRGASTKTPEAKEPAIGSMTDNEYRAYVQKKHGYTPFA